MRAVYDLATLPTQRRDDELVFGVADDPDNQAQPEIAFRPDKEGNIAIYGTSGSGKSVFLRSMAVAAGYTVRGGPCHVYGLDFGNRGLAMLESLPHVGSIIPGGDHERVTRLLRTLRATIDERASRYSAVSAATITDYRRLAGRPDEPRVIVLIDNMTAFRQAYEVGGRFQWLDLLAGLAADGRPVGVHFIIASDQRTGLPTNLAAAVQGRIILRMSNVDDYSVFGVPGDVLTMASPPGRGLMSGSEVQVAVLGGSSDVTVQAAAIEAFADATRKAGVSQAPPIESLAEVIPLGDLPSEFGGRPVVGVASSSLEPHGFDPKGTFIITGPSGLGAHDGGRHDRGRPLPVQLGLGALPHDAAAHVGAARPRASGPRRPSAARPPRRSPPGSPPRSRRDASRGRSRSSSSASTTSRRRAPRTP